MNGSNPLPRGPSQSLILSQHDLAAPYPSPQPTTAPITAPPIGIVYNKVNIYNPFLMSISSIYNFNFSNISSGWHSKQLFELLFAPDETSNGWRSK
jgi:hypothetical protein